MERGCAYIGMQLLREYYAIRRGIGHVYGRVRARVPILWRSLRFKVVRRTEHFADEVLFPYRILHDETAELAAALRDKTPEGKAGRREAWRDYSRAVARPLNRIANFFAPIFGLAILAGAIAFFNQFTFALRVEYNGESIGYIAQESDFYEARDAMLARLINEEYIPPEDTIPTLSLAVAKEKELLTKEELTDAIMRSSGNELVDASGFYLEGKFLGALEDGNEFLLYMDKVLNNYRTGEEHETVQFTKNIRLEDGVYPVSSLMTVSNLQSYLRSNKELRRSYTARPGETIEAIAKRYGLTLEEMYDLNMELEEYLTALRQQQLGYDPDSVILPDSGTPAEEWNARLEDISVNGETPLETAVNNGMVLYMGLLYWPEGTCRMAPPRSWPRPPGITMPCTVCNMASPMKRRKPRPMRPRRMPLPAIQPIRPIPPRRRRTPKAAKPPPAPPCRPSASSRWSRCPCRAMRNCWWCRWMWSWASR